MKANARDLFFRQRRFDLIFKYLYAVEGGKGYVRTAYIESIRAITDGTFVERNPSDGLTKETAEGYCTAFDRLLESLSRDGFDAVRGAIPIAANGEAVDGAHRLSACAALGLDVETRPDDEVCDYSFSYFQIHGMDPDVMDYGALRYVEFNPHARIVNLQQAADPSKDEAVRDILEKYGMIFYGKSVPMSFNGNVNLKKLSYGSFWERDPWIGTAADGFPGAQVQAMKSMGRGRAPMRIFVFVCEDDAKVLQAKAEIRALFGIGKISVHINDTHEEAVWLAQTYFNANSLKANAIRPFTYEDPRLDRLMDEMREFVRARGRKIGDVCAAGSTVLNVLGLRPCSDFDFFASPSEPLSVQSKTLSTVTPEWARFYPQTPDEIVGNPQFHFYFRGVKFAAPEVVLQMKLLRRDGAKDAADIKLLRRVLRCEKFNWASLSQSLRRMGEFLYMKRRVGPMRLIYLLGRPVFTYERRRR